MLQSVLDEAKGASPNALRIIETISKHNNTPRKKPKFINFVKNVCGQKTNIKDIDQAWDLISVKLSELSNLSSQNKNQNQKNGVSSANGNADDNKQNGVPETNGDAHDKLQNGDKKDEDVAAENGVNKEESSEVSGGCDNSEKKMSKKQRKEEKKKKKYEAELNSVGQQPLEEEIEETQVKKKNKKNKNKGNDVNDVENGIQSEGKNKNKKRKRQDTVNTIPEVVDNDVENENITKLKVQQKKPKVLPDEVSLSLHDQNVAKSEESANQKEHFDWHAVIISVLQKKDNEVPFKRLQKKVLGEYQETTGNEVDDRIAEKFIKKLKSAPNVRVDKNRVLLVQEG